MHHLTLKIDNTDYVQRLEAKLSKLKHAEEKMAARVIRIESEMWDEIENMKSEYRAGKFFLLPLQFWHFISDLFRHYNGQKSN